MRFTTLITEDTCARGKCGVGMHTKFDSCVTEAIHAATLDGTCETTGSVDWLHHVAIVTFGPDEVCLDGESVIAIAEGTYLVFEDGQGFVRTEHFVVQAYARARFDSDSRDYGRWLGSEDE